MYLCCCRTFSLCDSFRRADGAGLNGSNCDSFRRWAISTTVGHTCCFRNSDCDGRGEDFVASGRCDGSRDCPGQGTGAWARTGHGCSDCDSYCRCRRLPIIVHRGGGLACTRCLPIILRVDYFFGRFDGRRYSLW